MRPDATPQPTIVVPYEPAPPDSPALDTFVYLRPETNGIAVESALLKVIEQDPRYRSSVELVYLANIPGEFMTEERLVEQHYVYKIPFAREGKRHFTRSMQERFERHFRVSFAEARILGAFEALDELAMSKEELFRLWVSDNDLLLLNCQNIKRIGTVYVVNYDIPALLEKYTRGTDIAVMILRSLLSGDDFESMIDAMDHGLRTLGVLGERVPRRRAFHVSAGPFEQILDAKGHLFPVPDTHIDFRSIQFCRFLRDRGVDCREIEKAVHFPIMQFKTADGFVVEDCLFEYTRGDNYQVAYEKFKSAIAQFIIE
jgi:hypothetical protein